MDADYFRLDPEPQGRKGRKGHTLFLCFAFFAPLR